jgi:hypothetical protein
MSTAPSRDGLWAAAHAALDARRDPLDDPRVRAGCGAFPAEAERLARLLERLALVGAPAARPAARRAALLAVAGALCALALARALAGAGAQPRPTAAPVAQGEVLRYRMTLSTVDPRGRRVHEDRDGRHEYTLDPRDTTAPRAHLARWTLRRTSE